MIPPPPRSTLFPYTTLFRPRHDRGKLLSHRAASVPASSPTAATVDSPVGRDRKSTRLNSSHGSISYAVFCLKKKKKETLNVINGTILSDTSMNHENGLITLP